MKRFFFFICVLAILSFAVPSLVVAQSNYITLKPGIYSPQSNDLKHFDTGFNGEIAFGHQYNPNFAIEMGLGYFNTEATFRGAGQVTGISYAGEERDSLDVVPIILTFKGIIPVNNWEFFGLGGIGAYVVNTDVKLSGSVGPYTGRLSDSDTDTIFGVHLGLGLHYNITPSWFVGAEGKYLLTSKAKYGNAEFKIDGILATAVLGFRF